MKKPKYRTTPKKPSRDSIGFTSLTTRVSLEEQASNPEGSLANQLQRLRAHIQYKKEADSEQWREAGVYELRGVSGKNSVRSPEFQRLFDDICTGRKNSVLVTAVNRICRSVSDILAFDLYLDLGSIRETADTLNRRGYRTKAYTSRRGKHHPGSEISVSSLQYLLKNPAYISKKEIVQDRDAGGGRRLVKDKQ